MLYYNPETKQTLTKQGLALKFNVSLPSDVEFFKGFYKLYEDPKPTADTTYYNVKLNPIEKRDDKYVRTFTVTEKPIVVLRNQLNAKVKAEFEKMYTKAYLTSSTGITIDANEAANRNVNGLIDLLSDDPSMEGTVFRGYNNDYHEVTLDDLKTFKLEITRNGSYLYAQKWEYEKVVEACDSVADIKAVEIKFTNMSFAV